MTAKIPTLLGITLLTAGLSLGVFSVTRNQIFKTRASPSFSPQNVSVTNLSDTSASLSWQTADPTTGFVRVGQSGSLDQTFSDDRDQATPQKHNLHFVTLTNLTPQTTYYYQINSGDVIYPASGTVSIKTTPPQTSSNLPPLIGSVIDSALQPVEEALVSLSIPNQPPLSTITKVSGNFILPLTLIKTDPAASISAQLKISGIDKNSTVTLPIPFSGTTIPPLQLGKDLDLTLKPTPVTKTLQTYDLNGDGVVNALDVSIVIKNLGKAPGDKRADFNGDGVVDQKDLNLINQFITLNSSR